jgi:hypothetical protein
MPFHDNPIGISFCMVLVITIKRRSIKLPFSSQLTSTKLKEMANGIALWHEKDIAICKWCNCILYIKANSLSICLFVCVDKNWAVPRRFFQSLFIPCGAGDKQGRVGRPGQPLWGAARGAIFIKEILGENWGTCI